MTDKEKKDAPKAAPKAAPKKYDSKAKYVVAPGRACTQDKRRKMLKAGDPVGPDLFIGGEKSMEHLLNKGTIVAAD